MRAREGSVVLDKRIKTWNFFWWGADGKRHSKTIGTLHDSPPKQPHGKQPNRCAMR